ncbi:MAG TPA: response regulator [Aliidongia sp.]|nr:response regulator [Aliidongia sp.]
MSLVLVIDDDPMMRSLMARLIESMGHTTMTAENGEDGLALFEQFRPALVVTDLVMPLGGGDELIPRIRRIVPDVKIIAVSGRAVTGSAEEARLLAADAMVGKPFRVAEFIGTIDNILGRSNICLSS